MKKTYPKILDNPYFRNRARDILVTNHPVKYNGVGIRVYSKDENAIVIYPLAGREFSRIEDYLKLEWYDTHDEGRNFIPCDRATIEQFLKGLVENRK